METGKYKSNKWRSIGIQISICIDKILTAGHKVSIKYNPLGRQIEHNEHEEVLQDDENEEDPAQE